MSYHRDFTVLSTEEVEKYLKKFLPIALKVRPKSLAELVHRLFYQKEATYRLVGSTIGRFVCSQGRARSIEDLYLLCRTYYPKMTLQDCQTVVRELYGYGKTQLTHNKCTVINRIVHHPINRSTSASDLKSVIDYERRNKSKLKGKV